MVPQVLSLPLRAVPPTVPAAHEGTLVPYQFIVRDLHLVKGSPIRLEYERQLARAQAPPEVKTEEADVEMPEASPPPEAPSATSVAVPVVAETTLSTDSPSSEVTSPADSPVPEEAVPHGTGSPAAPEEFVDEEAVEDNEETGSVTPTESSVSDISLLSLRFSNLIFSLS